MLFSRKELLDCTVVEVLLHQSKNISGCGIFVNYINSGGFASAGLGEDAAPMPVGGPPCAISERHMVGRGGDCGENKGKQISWESVFVFPSRRVTQISARAPVTQPTTTRCYSK